jgi:hypothetical protein
LGGGLSGNKNVVAFTGKVYNFNKVKPEARSSNLGTWESSQHVLEDRGKLT